MRGLLKKILPERLVLFVKQVRLRTLRGYLCYEFARWRYRKVFLEANPSLHMSASLDDVDIILPKVGSARFSSEAVDAVEHFGWKEPSMVNELRNFVALIRGKKCLIDVGANYGVFSVLFLGENRHATALAIDPDPRALRLLERHAAMNHVAGRLLTSNSALGRVSGAIRMKESGPHYVVEPDDQQSAAISVSMTSLDELVAKHRLSPDCIKVDVEGFELEVLMGGLNTLQSCSPLLFLEIHATSDGAMESELFELLRNLGYGIRDERNIRADFPNQCAAEYSGSAFRVVARRDK